MNRTHQLVALGQSLWLDNISRAWLNDGTLGRHIRDLSVTGVTSSPAGLDQAIRRTDAYNDSILTKTLEGRSPTELCFELLLADLCGAADLLRPAHDASSGLDGWVSQTVSPALAGDTLGMVRAAAELHARAGRPNYFVGIPGNAAGLEAIEATIFAGIPVNVTQLYSWNQYIAAAEAYMRGIERRLAAGLGPNVASVASLVVSPWDVAGNAVLGPALNNRLGTAVAMRTFKLYRDLLVGQRWRRLGLAGAPVQRLLWTATDSPDPYLGDTYYVEALAAPNTINAMPEATLLAFADRGSATMTFTVAAARADATLAEVAAAGVDVDAMGIELQLSGIVSALDAWQESIRCIEARSGTVENARQGSLASPRL